MASGQIAATNPGNVPADTVFTIWGPVTDPWIGDDTGKRMNLDLTLAAGEWVTVDSATGQVLAQGDPAASRRANWYGDRLRVKPGQTTFTLGATTSGPGAQVRLDYRHTWI